MEIVVASGNSAVPVAVLELGGGDTGGDDVGITVTGDVVAPEEVVPCDDVELIAPVTMKDAIPV